MSNEPAVTNVARPTPPADRDAKPISSTQLFAGQKEVCIEHDGVRYRLRITRRNKLILQK